MFSGRIVNLSLASWNNNNNQSCSTSHIVIQLFQKSWLDFFWVHKIFISVTYDYWLRIWTLCNGNVSSYTSNYYTLCICNPYILSICIFKDVNWKMITQTWLWNIKTWFYNSLEWIKLQKTSFVPNVNWIVLLGNRWNI